MKMQYTALATLLAGLLSACGGSNNSTENKPQLNTLAGQVMAGAGYIQGAKVCMDTNDNAKCDDAEPSVISGTNGEYQFENLTDAALTQSPLIAEVGTEAINSDTNKAVKRPYLMSAPANSNTVSPESAQVKHYMDVFKITRAEAEELVKSIMEVEAETAKQAKEKYKNHQEAAKSSNPKIKEMAMHIKNMFLVMTYNMGNAYEGIQTNPSGAPAFNGVSIPDSANVTHKQLMKLVMQKQIDSMPTINKVAHQHAESGASQDTDFANINSATLAKMQLQTDKLDEQVKALAASNSSTPANLQEALTDNSIHQFTSDKDNVVPNIQVNSFNIENQMLNETQKKADRDNPSLAAFPKPEKHDFLVPDGNGDWMRPDNVYEVKPNSDSTKVDLVNKSNPDLKTTLSALEHTLEDLNTDTQFLSDPSMKTHMKLMSGDATFSDDAKAMKVTSSINKETLMLDNPLACEIGNELDRRTCFTRVSAHNNNVVTLDPVSLSDITSTEPSNGDIEKLKGAVVAYNGSRYIVAELLLPENSSAEGIANYYLVQMVTADDGSKKEASLFATGSWKEQATIIHKLILAVLTVPEKVLAFDTSGNTKKDMFYTEADDKVRQGHKGFSMPMDGVVVNMAAMNDISNNMDTEKLSSSPIEQFIIQLKSRITPCATGNSINGKLLSKSDYDVSVSNCQPFLVSYGLLPPEKFTADDTPLISYDDNGDQESKITLSSQDSDETPWKVGAWQGTASSTSVAIRWKIDEKGHLTFEKLDDSNEPVERVTMAPLEREGIVLSTKVFHEDKSKAPIDGKLGIISDKTFIVNPPQP
ncbi:hypothetical protein D5018_13905 [Parashewanella curva]|uniref:Uncharacterized protein n=1 Tax=Parashewanella curva TaxID=2338552 RepID=A0A3L8PUU5_9GAMM|nr:hypothetical protein [Parashewanella curva]RLV59100.1 hypothetical protein D5018_13905 [Parashewanella curva]